MSRINDQILGLKNALMLSLGDNFQRYLFNLKMWLSHKWTKEQFDTESRKILNVDGLNYHNRFMIAILNKIYMINNSYDDDSSKVIVRVSRKRKRHRTSFVPNDYLKNIPEDNLELIRPPNQPVDDLTLSLPPQRYCVQELFLPDMPFIIYRFMVGAWENSLIGVDDTVGEYICVAVQILLKNIISAIIMKRKHYKVTCNGTFYYDVGAQVKTPFQRNTIARQKIDETPIENREISSTNMARRFNDDSLFLSASEEFYPQIKHKITVTEVYNALKDDRNVIPSHMIYSINMERLSQMLR